MHTVSDTSGPHRFVEAVKQALRTHGWAQKRLAEFVGKDVSTVSLWLSGRHKPRPDDESTITKLAEFLRQEPATLRTWLLESPEELQEESVGTPQRLTILSTPEDCSALFDADPSLLERLLPVQTRLSFSGLAATLEAYGYSVRPETLRTALAPHLLSPSYLWDRETQVIMRQGPAALPETGFAPPFQDLIWERDCVRQACQALNAAFAATAQEILPTTAVLTLLQEVLPPDRPTVTAGITAATLFAHLKHLQFLSEEEPGMLRRRWVLSPEYVMNRYWGRPSYIPGLDVLLDGGLLPPASGGLSVLVEGLPGTGKTTLALQLAASIALQQGWAIYLSAEEQLSRLRERLSFAGYGLDQAASRHVQTDPSTQILRRDDKTCALVACNFLDSFLTGVLLDEHAQAQRGVLLLVALPDRWAFERKQDPFLRSLQWLLQTAAQHGLPSCYVVDSLEGVLHTGGRHLYEQLFTVRDQSMGIFLSEERHQQEQMDERLLRAHLVDMVLHLGHRISSASSLQRTIEIRKSRNQYCLQGQHLFAIQPQQGITVYPSVQALLSIWRQRIRRATAAEPERWKIGGSQAHELDLNQLLHDDVVRGSMILLTGPPATHKLALGLTFLASQLADDPQAEALFISLREDAASVLDILETYPQLHSLLGAQPRSLNPRLWVLHRPPTYFSAAGFLHWLRHQLASLRQAGHDIRRLVFNNLNQLRHNSPLFAEEPLFIAALLELFRKQRITSLFIQVQGEDALSANVFDTILFTDRWKKRNQPDTVRFWTGHTTRCDAIREAWWLHRVRDPQTPGRGWLELHATPPRVERSATQQSIEDDAHTPPLPCAVELI